MDSEPGPSLEKIEPRHAQTSDEVRGWLRSRLVDGAFDVLRNGHEDEVVISDGRHVYRHRLDRTEAAQLEEAAWSAGEDRTLEALVDLIVSEVEGAGITFGEHDLDITLSLRPESPHH